MAFAAVVAVILILYASFKKFEVAIFLFALSPIISTIFYNNTPSLEDLISEETVGPGGYLRAGLLLSLGIIGIVNYIKDFKNLKGKLPNQLIIFAVFILFALGSAFFSIDQRFTLIRSTMLIAVFGFLLGFYTWLKQDGSMEKALNTLFIFAAFSVLVSLVSLVVIPQRVWWWKANRMIGLFQHPNNFGAFCMLLYPIFIWKYYNTQNSKKYWVLLLIMLNLLLHILSGSRTTLISASIGYFIWLIFEKNWVKLFFSAITVAIAFVVLIYAAPSSFSRQNEAKLTDLSSREDIWQSAYIFIKDKPVLGYGFGVEGKVFENEQKLDLEGSFIHKSARQSLHSGYLSIIIGLGITGLILWLLTLLFPLWLGFSADFSTVKAYSIITIIMVLITNFVESALTGYSLATDTFFWIAWIIAGNLWLINNQKKQNILTV